MRKRDRESVREKERKNSEIAGDEIGTNECKRVN